LGVPQQRKIAFVPDRSIGWSIDGRQSIRFGRRYGGLLLDKNVLIDLGSILPFGVWNYQQLFGIDYRCGGSY
jgi:hypothetical protein